MRVGPRTYARFPGRPAVLKALREAGGAWTPTDAFRWACSNGGSEPTYSALAHYVARGKLDYDGKRWQLS